MFGAWIVESVIRFSSNGVRTMEGITLATDRANISLARQLGYIRADEAAMLRYGMATEKAAASHAKLITAIAGGVAIAGGAALWEGLKQAGELQRSMTAVNIATMNKAPANMQRLVMRVSGMTAQDATTIANELATVAQTGINDPTRLKAMFPQFAMAADVGFLGPKHMDPTKTVEQLAKFSHMFGIYSGPKFTKMIDDAMKVIQMQPDGIEPMLRQGKLFVGQSMKAGVPMEQIFQQLMLMGQTGFLQGRGGSGIGNFIARMEGAATMTGHLSKAEFLAMKELGMWDPTGHNKFIKGSGPNEEFNVNKALAYLTERSKTMDASKFVTDLRNAFTTSGGNYLAVITRQQVAAQQAQNLHNFNAMPTVSEQWRKYMENFLSQTSRAATNFKNLVIDVFTPVLPQWTGFMKSLANTLGNVGDVLTAHPDMAKSIAQTLTAMTGFATAIFAVGAGGQVLRLGGFGSAAAGGGAATGGFALAAIVGIAEAVALTYFSQRWGTAAGNSVRSSVGGFFSDPAAIVADARLAAFNLGRGIGAFNRSLDLWVAGIPAWLQRATVASEKAVHDGVVVLVKRGFVGGLEAGESLVMKAGSQTIQAFINGITGGPLWGEVGNIGSSVLHSLFAGFGVGNGAQKPTAPHVQNHATIQVHSEVHVHGITDPKKLADQIDSHIYRQVGLGIRSLVAQGGWYRTGPNQPLPLIVKPA